MATPTTKNTPAAFDAAFGQVKELNEQFLTAARKAGTVYLDAYEKAVDRAIELERELAGTTQQEWLKNLLETQADLARDATDSYTSAARSLLK
jgi:hypothetical protein